MLKTGVYTHTLCHVSFALQSLSRTLFFRLQYLCCCAVTTSTTNPNFLAPKDSPALMQQFWDVSTFYQNVAPETDVITSISIPASCHQMLPQSVSQELITFLMKKAKEKKQKQTHDSEITPQHISGELNPVSMVTSAEHEKKG